MDFRQIFVNNALRGQRYKICLTDKRTIFGVPKTGSTRTSPLIVIVDGKDIIISEDQIISMSIEQNLPPDKCDYPGCDVSGGDKITHTMDYTERDYLGQTRRAPAGTLRSRCTKHYEPPRKMP